MHRIYIPEAFIALNQEIPHHPLLMQRIQKHPPGNPELVLAEIAAYCYIEVDGVFVEEELAVLAEKCLKMLVATRPRPEIYLPKEDWEAAYIRILEEQEKKGYESNKLISIPRSFKKRQT